MGGNDTSLASEGEGTRLNTKHGSLYIASCCNIAFGFIMKR